MQNQIIMHKPSLFQMILTIIYSGISKVHLKNALAYAYNKGMTIVAAAGNDGRSKISYLSLSFMDRRIQIELKPSVNARL
ncbi:hypothetical protein E9840_04545 [Tissierella creatinini]|nr:hypothetical protein E9840_04545 [Tissierella creatinini]TJX63964.1 hypothetical protein E8P77_13560 [Soehngenia saccharolytica]